MVRYPDPDGAKRLWTIVRIEDTSLIPSGGPPTRAKRVYYVLLDGTQSYVEVPVDQFTPEVVGSMIQRDAAAHYAVRGIQGPTLEEVGM